MATRRKTDREALRRMEARAERKLREKKNRSAALNSTARPAEEQEQPQPVKPNRIADRRSPLFRFLREKTPSGSACELTMI